MENQNKYRIFDAPSYQGVFATLTQRYAVSDKDAWALCRIGKTLRTWYARHSDCRYGYDDDGRRGHIERDEETQVPYWVCAFSGERLWQMRDLERGALKQLDKIMARYPHLVVHLESDPRKAAIYILRKAELIEELPIASYCHMGLAIN